MSIASLRSILVTPARAGIKGSEEEIGYEPERHPRTRGD